MGDIVERLRDAFNPEYWTSEIRTEAADEIERLRGGDRHIAQLVRDLAEVKADRDRLIAELRALKEVKNHEPG